MYRVWQNSLRRSIVCGRVCMGSLFTSSLASWVGSGGSCLEPLPGRRGFLGGRQGRFRWSSGKEKQKRGVRLCMEHHSGALCVLWLWFGKEKFMKNRNSVWKIISSRGDMVAMWWEISADIDSFFAGDVTDRDTPPFPREERASGWRPCGWEEARSCSLGPHVDPHTCHYPGSHIFIMFPNRHQGGEKNHFQLFRNEEFLYLHRPDQRIHHHLAWHL